MARKPWTLTDDDWHKIEPVLPRSRGGRPRTDDRTVITGLLHALGTGAPFSELEPYGNPRSWRQGSAGGTKTARCSAFATRSASSRCRARAAPSPPDGDAPAKGDEREKLVAVLVGTASSGGHRSLVLPIGCLAVPPGRKQDRHRIVVLRLGLDEPGSRQWRKPQVRRGPREILACLPADDQQWIPPRPLVRLYKKPDAGDLARRRPVHCPSHGRPLDALSIGSRQQASRHGRDNEFPAGLLLGAEVVGHLQLTRRHANLVRDRPMPAITLGATNGGWLAWVAHRDRPSPGRFPHLWPPVCGGQRRVICPSSAEIRGEGRRTSRGRPHFFPPPPPARKRSNCAARGSGQSSSLQGNRREVLFGLKGVSGANSTTKFTCSRESGFM